MRAQEFITEDTVHRGGIDVEHHEDAEQPNIMWITASTHGRELGRVKFLRKGDRAVALDLAVKPEYQGQGIAKIMYDYAKEIGYRILRSAEQTDAGHGFWDKYRGEQGVWESELDEVQILSRVKGKGSEPSRLPRLGREIPPGEEEQYLGRYVTDIRPGQQLWRQYVTGEVNYHLFDTGTRRAVMTMFGTRYPRNPNSLIVSGVYASPDNTMRASDFYRFLIVDQGITMVSDRKQSPGGQNIWRQLERFPDVEVYGMDTRTGEILNIGAADEEMYAVPPGAARDRETRKVARDIRLVATAK
jgi:GNAT superfamily N-acetyltransferase